VFDMSQVCLEIGDLATLMALLTDEKKKGILKNVSLEQIETLFQKKSFPIRVPVDVFAILEAADNKIVKMKQKKIEEKTVEILNEVLRAQA
jgi:fumarylacetoacetate (FAA) hydrolase family protein